MSSVFSCHPLNVHQEKQVRTTKVTDNIKHFPKIHCMQINAKKNYIQTFANRGQAYTTLQRSIRCSLNYGTVTEKCLACLFLFMIDAFNTQP